MDEVEEERLGMVLLWAKVEEDLLATTSNDHDASPPPVPREEAGPVPIMPSQPRHGAATDGGRGGPPRRG
jgi:hypothetical protein